MSLRDRVAEATDVQTETVFIEAWDANVEFRGMSYAALMQIQNSGVTGDDVNPESAIDMLAAVMADPDTHELAFADEEGKAILRTKSQEAILECVQVALRVLGIDEADTAGKGSSSTTNGGSPTSGV